MKQALASILELKCITLFYNDDFDICRRIIDSLYAGGSRVIEFTNRGDKALELFIKLAHAYNNSDIMLGAGTMRTREDVLNFIDAGAHFLVSPFFDKEVMSLSVENHVPFIPGCQTVSEINESLKTGAQLVKIFPGEAAGGPSFIKAVLAPMPGLKLMPTGGVTPEEENLTAWMEAGASAVGLGSQLIKKEWVRDGDYDSITKATASVMSILARY